MRARAHTHAETYTRTHTHHHSESRILWGKCILVGHLFFSSFFFLLFFPHPFFFLSFLFFPSFTIHLLFVKVFTVIAKHNKPSHCTVQAYHVRSCKITFILERLISGWYSTLYSIFNIQTTIFSSRFIKQPVQHYLCPSPSPPSLPLISPPCHFHPVSFFQLVQGNNILVEIDGIRHYLALRRTVARHPSPPSSSSSSPRCSTAGHRHPSAVGSRATVACCRLLRHQPLLGLAVFKVVDWEGGTKYLRYYESF